jgi:hypothetical protein
VLFVGFLLQPLGMYWASVAGHELTWHQFSLSWIRRYALALCPGIVLLLLGSGAAVMCIIIVAASTRKIAVGDGDVRILACGFQVSKRPVCGSTVAAVDGGPRSVSPIPMPFVASQHTWSIISCVVKDLEHVRGPIG